MSTLPTKIKVKDLKPGMRINRIRASDPNAVLFIHNIAPVTFHPIHPSQEFYVTFSLWMKTTSFTTFVANANEEVELQP